MERNKTVDILRGIATLAVLLGHAIQRGLITGYVDNIVFRFIYSFHMPLFIILSGYTLYLSNPKYDVNFLWKKVKRLLFPTILWSYIMYVTKDLWFVGIKPFITFPDSILSYTKTLLLHPDYIYWFLYIIFIFSIVFYIAKKLPKNYFGPTLLIIGCIFWILPVEYFGMYNLRLYFPLFVLGYGLASKKETIIPQLKYYVVPCLLFFLYYFRTWQPGHPSIILFYLLSISVSMMMYWIITHIKIKWIEKILSWFGQNSLYIYLYQCLCLNIGYGSGIVRVGTIFITATLISSILAYFTSKNKYVKALLYGSF